VLIYVVVAVQFNSLRQSLIVMLAVPLSVIGVTLGLLVTGTPFSFMVFIGVVSLTACPWRTQSAATVASARCCSRRSRPSPGCCR
jgi:Cu/Ag efflux pump CusA